MAADYGRVTAARAGIVAADERPRCAWRRDDPRRDRRRPRRRPHRAEDAARRRGGTSRSSPRPATSRPRGAPSRRTSPTCSCSTSTCRAAEPGGDPRASRGVAGDRDRRADDAAGPRLRARGAAAGALGYVLKEAADAELLRGRPARAEGRTYLNPRLGARMAAEPPPSGPPDGLTERELEILRLIALGHTNTEIAEQLYLSRAHGRVPPRAHPAEDPARPPAPSSSATRSTTASSTPTAERHNPLYQRGELRMAGRRGSAHRLWAWHPRSSSSTPAPTARRRRSPTASPPRWAPTAHRPTCTPSTMPRPTSPATTA